MRDSKAPIGDYWGLVGLIRVPRLLRLVSLGKKALRHSLDFLTGMEIRSLFAAKDLNGQLRTMFKHDR